MQDTLGAALAGAHRFDGRSTAKTHVSAVDEVPDINRLRSRRPYALIFETDTFVRWKCGLFFLYPAIGTVTNLAARLCSEAKGGQVARKR